MEIAATAAAKKYEMFEAKLIARAMLASECRPRGASRLWKIAQQNNVSKEGTLKLDLQGRTEFNLHEAFPVQDSSRSCC